MLSDDTAVTAVRGIEVRERNPWGVFALVVLTLGLYYLVWYYRVNDELQRFGEATGIRPNPLHVCPDVSVLAVTLGGFLIVPAVVSPYRTAARIRRAQELSGTELRLNPMLALLLYLCGLMFVPVECVYAQRHLNAMWAHEGEEAEKASLGMRGPVVAAPVPAAPTPRGRPLPVTLAAIVVAAAVIVAAFAIAIATAEGGQGTSAAVADTVPTERDLAVQHFYEVMVHVGSYHHRNGSYAGLSMAALGLEAPYHFHDVTAMTFCLESWVSDFPRGGRMWSARDERLETLAPRRC